MTSVVEYSGKMGAEIEVSDEFYDFLSEQRRDNEDIEDTLRRLIGEPLPTRVSGIISPDTADKMRNRLDE